MFFAGGILTNRAQFGDKLPTKGDKGHRRNPSEDFIMGTSSNLSFIQSSVNKMHVKSNESVVTNGDGTPNVMTSSSEGTQESMMSSQSDGSMPAEQNDGAQVVMTSSDAAVENNQSGAPLEGSVSSPQLNRSRSGSNSSVVSQGSKVSLQGSTSPSPQHKGVISNIPKSLADLQNPNTFQIGQSPPTTRKVTKQNFTNKTTSIKDSLNDPNDPLSNLDPLWSVKGKTNENTGNKES